MRDEPAIDLETADRGLVQGHMVERATSPIGQTFVIELCQTDSSALTLPVPEPTTRGEARVINTEKRVPARNGRGSFAFCKLAAEGQISTSEYYTSRRCPSRSDPLRTRNAPNKCYTERKPVSRCLGRQQLLVLLAAIRRSGLSAPGRAPS